MTELAQKCKRMLIFQYKTLKRFISLKNGLFLFFSLVVNLDIFKKDLTKYQYKPTTGECDRWMNSSPFLIFIGWLFRERGDCSVTRWGDF